MGKRKQDQRSRREDTSSSSSCLDSAKRPRHRHYKNWPNDGMSRDGFHDAFIELKDALLAKFSTEGNFKRKIEKLKEKRKKDKNKHRENLRILKEDLRILKQSHENLKSKIHELRKERCAEASPQSQLIQSTTFRLVIENRLRTPIYKNEMIETEDGGGHIKVVLYDGGRPIAPDHPLASVKVELVVIEGRFNNDKRESWSKEEFEKSIITPREGMTRLMKNGTFNLNGGSCYHQGAIIMDNSQKKEVRIGVMIATPIEGRVVEGVSNLFRVQEVKTKRPRKNGRQSSLPAHILGKSTSTNLTQREDYGPSSHPPPTVPLMVQGNGQDVNGNTQNFSRQFPAQTGVQSASANVQFGSCAQPNDFQAAVNQHLPAHGQDQSHKTSSFPNGSSELALQTTSMFERLQDIQHEPIAYYRMGSTSLEERLWALLDAGDEDEKDGAVVNNVNESGEEELSRKVSRG